MFGPGLLTSPDVTIAWASIILLIAFAIEFIHNYKSWQSAVAGGLTILAGVLLVMQLDGLQYSYPWLQIWLCVSAATVAAAYGILRASQRKARGLLGIDAAILLLFTAAKIRYGMHSFLSATTTTREANYFLAYVLRTLMIITAGMFAWISLRDGTYAIFKRWQGRRDTKSALYDSAEAGSPSDGLAGSAGLAGVQQGAATSVGGAPPQNPDSPAPGASPQGGGTPTAPTAMPSPGPSHQGPGGTTPSTP